jgi:mannopine transport system permease protein
MSSASRRRAPRPLFGPWLVLILLAPTVALFLGAFAYPIGLLMSESLYVKGVVSLENFGRIVDRPLYIATLVRTLRVGGLTTLICLMIGFPLAYWMTRLRGADKETSLSNVNSMQGSKSCAQEIMEVETAF